MDKSELAQLLVEMSKEYETFVYSGDIDQKTVSTMQDAVEPLQCKEKKARLFLTTYGGDPHAAYRLIHCLHCCFAETRLVLVGDCKSAGTLVAVGADELAFGSRGELGPLDVQLRSPDELYRWSSGLDIMQTVRTVTEQAEAAFARYVVGLTTAGISTLTASKMASDLAGEIFGPIAAQIDPLKLGESERAMRIAKEYGRRLGATARLKARGLERLIEDYPSHGTVIDMYEAEEIFENVSAMSDQEKLVTQAWSEVLESPARPAIAFAVRRFYEIMDIDQTGGDKPDGAPDNIGEDHAKNANGEPGREEETNAPSDNAPSDAVA